MKEFLIEVVKNTDGWVIVVVALMYFLYEGFEDYRSGRALDKTLDMVKDTFATQIDRLQTSIDRLIDKVSSL